MCTKNECDTKYDMSVNDTGCAWQSGLLNANMANVNVFYQKITH